MIRYSEIFFESFSMAVEAAYEAYLKIVGGEFPREEDGENKLGLYLRNEYMRWLDTPQEKLAGKTPSEYLDSIEGLDNLMVMFQHGAVICDEDLPDIYLQKLKQYGVQAEDALIRLAAQVGNDRNDDAVLAPLMAVRVLGLWKVEKAVGPLIDILDQQDDMFDLMFETIRDALVRIGQAALEPVSEALQSGKYSPAAEEYLLVAFTEIGKRNRSDAVFRQLKKSFLKMQEKLIAAGCLGDYGDGRAVPVLRGYIEKNADSINKETFYEIVAAVRKLGGRTDDLKYRNSVP